MIYYVSPHGNNTNAGTADAPFRTINHAAQVALPGDTVRVHGGTYREWVVPKNSGEENARIVYEAVEGENPIIKGSEAVTDWEHVEGTVWKKALPNTVFGDFNPYASVLYGDWLIKPNAYQVHLGDVYVGGKSMYEASSMEDLFKAPMRSIGVNQKLPLLYPEDTVYRWFAEVTDTQTVIYGNFQEKDPNTEAVEINVRPCCFYPEKMHVNYITVRGFEMAHAATQWAPPTASQIGMIGPHWSKGWIIENNDLHDSKCCAISVGRDKLEGENLSYRYCKKSGHRYQVEATYEALKEGWSKETVGSHLIRNNEIHDCGQCGIVGNLGGVFSRIEHNHIHDVAVKQEFWGHELGGIKMHCSIDTTLIGNHIHHCSTHGTWLDWQAQGTRVTKNVYHDNSPDLMIEVSHGPCTVDNNLLLSQYALINHAQGTAFVHNLIAGYVFPKEHKGRATPYHYPHSTFPKGFVATLGGDDRVYGNIVLGTEQPPEQRAYFSSCYNKYLTCEEYEETRGRNHYISLVETVAKPQPVYIAENVYTSYAKPFRKEIGALKTSCFFAELTEENNGDVILSLTVPQEVSDMRITPTTTERLGTPRVVEQPYTNPDGTPIDFVTDMLGHKRNENIIPGPFAMLTAGKNCFTVWKK